MHLGHADQRDDRAPRLGRARDPVEQAKHIAHARVAGIGKLGPGEIGPAQDRSDGGDLPPACDIGADGMRVAEQHAEQEGAEIIEMRAPIVDEQVAILPARRQEIVGAEEDRDADREQGRACQNAFGSRFGSVPDCGRQGQHRTPDQGVDKQIHDEPEVHVSRHEYAVDLLRPIIIVRQEIAEAMGVAVLGDELDPGLRRDEDQHAGEERNAEPRKARSDECADAFAAFEQGGAGETRYREQERQAPGVGQEHRNHRPGDRWRHLDREGPWHERHAHMIEDQKLEGADPQPIHSVMPACRLARFHRRFSTGG